MNEQRDFVLEQFIEIAIAPPIEPDWKPAIPSQQQVMPWLAAPGAEIEYPDAAEAGPVSEPVFEPVFERVFEA
jgi:hypothetical protein